MMGEIRHPPSGSSRDKKEEPQPVQDDDVDSGCRADGGRIDGDGEPGRPCKVPARWVRVPMP